MKILVLDWLRMVSSWWTGKVVENLLSWSRIMKMPWQGAKKNHLNICQYGDITQDDAREFGAQVKPAR